MSLQKVVRIALLFAFLLALHFSVRPLMQWRAQPDFLVVAVMLAAVRVRPGVAAILGFVTGLLADSLSPGAFGIAAFALSVLGFAASWLKAVFFSDNVALHAFFFFVGKWVFDALFIVLERQRTLLEAAAQIALWSPLAAAQTALLGLVVLMLFRGMLEANAT
ncbi:MAG: rod shape-determining protein MreD [Gemmatimonadaceae bacterium]|nr:rod shape-determining protein MreD [Gemmatimonadaceae bacterium]